MQWRRVVGQGIEANSLKPRFTYVGSGPLDRMFTVQAEEYGGRIGWGGFRGFCIDGNGKALTGLDVVQGYGFEVDNIFVRRFVTAGIVESDRNSTNNVAYANRITNIQTDCGFDEACYSMIGVWINSLYNEGNPGVTNCTIENVRGNMVLGDLVYFRGTDTNYTTNVQAVSRIPPLPTSTAVTAGTWYYVQSRVYKVTASGTTDTLSNLPTFTSGSATNGTATLEYKGRLGGAVGFRNATTKWATGQTVAIGDVRYYRRNAYVAASAGTTGSTAPTHTSGSASDGGVSWTYSRPAFHTQKNPVMHLSRGYAYSQEGTIGNYIVFHNGEGGGSIIAPDSTLSQLCIADHITGAFFRSWSYELDDELALPLSDAYVVTGTPDLTTGGSGALHRHWNFDPDTVETIAWSVDMPPRWENGVVTRMRVRLNGAAGNVRLRFRVQQITTSNGYNITLGGSTVDVTVPVSTTFSYAELALVTPQIVTEACMLHVEFSRLGTHGEDTSAADLRLCGSPHIRFNGNGPAGNPYLGPWGISPRKLSY